MARKTIVIAECDNCGATESVAEHTAAVDGRVAVFVDACQRCWAEHYEPFARLLAKGRSEKIAARQPKVSRASSAPTSPRKITAKKATGGRSAAKTTARKSAAKQATSTGTVKRPGRRPTKRAAPAA